MDIEVGGQIQGISLGSFLQIVNMDKTSCTLKIYSSDIIGYLYIVNGELIAAETGSMRNVEAAYEIISWNNTIIVIDNAPPPDQNIKMPLMSILMEGLRIKDEKNARKGIDSSSEDALPEPVIEFDPNNYESKDDEIASRFCEPESATENDIVLDYSSVDMDEPPPTMYEKEPLAVEPVRAETEEEIPVAATSDLPKDYAGPPVLPDEEVVSQEDIDDSEEVLLGFDDEIAPPKTDLKRTLKFGLILFIVGLFGIYFGPNLYTRYKLKTEYLQLIKAVDSAPSYVRKSELLTRYLKSHGDNSYIKDVTSDLNQVDILIDIDKKIRAFDVDKNFMEKSGDLYRGFIKQFPRGKYVSDAMEKMDGLPAVVDEMDYKAIAGIHDLSKSQRMAKYNDYLKNHPKGKYVQQVENLIAAVGDEYYLLLQEKSVECDRNKNWEECILLAGVFIENFKMDPRIVETRILRDKLYDKTDLEDMRRKSRDMAFEEARQMFVAYMQNNPNSSVVNEVSVEISNINKKIDLLEQWNEIKAYAMNKDVKIMLQINEVKQYIAFNPESPFLEDANALLKQLQYKERNLGVMMARARQKKIEDEKRAQILKEKQQLEAERERLRLARIAREKKEARLQVEEKKFAELIDTISNRFTNNGDRTITDNRTGMTWVMLDSLLESGECMNYKDAIKYVKELNTGGYTDWRLPMPSELAVFYNSKPYYPSSNAKWYWTAKTATGAWGQNEKTIIFRSSMKNEFTSEHKEQDECGYVHAIRSR
jgi:hypothetical protein